ncbi:MAG: hypothetical protein HPY64_02775 [Anaerolineae bacterium]|nr:hypothetical protein [Anaerolineae bacterium]
MAVKTAGRGWLTAAAGLLALAIALVLIVLAIAPGSASLTAADEGAQIHLSADRRWTILPGGCVTVAWAVAGVREVYLDGEGVTGEGSRLLCAREDEGIITPILRIITSSGAERFYALHIPALTGRGEFWLALAAIVGLGGAAAIGLFPALDERRREIITGMLLLAAAGIGAWLIWLFVNPAPLTIWTAERGGLVSFSATPIRPPDDCTMLVWTVEGIQQVWLNGEAVTGQGERHLCGADIHDLRLTVTFRDGSQRNYRFPPNRLLYPAGLLALCGAVLLAVLAADVWRGARLRLSLSLSRYDAVGLIGAVGVTALLYGYLLSQAVQTTDDYWVHLNFAAAVLESGTTPLPHFLFQALAVALAGMIPGGDLTVAGILVGAAAYASTSALAYVLLGQALDRAEGWPQAGLLAGLALAVCLMDVATLPVPGYDSYTYRLAYISLQPLHNPTYPLMRPFALLQFIVALRVLSDQRAPGMAWPAALVSVVATWAKPNYAIVLLPALALLAAARWLRGKRLDWWLLLGGLILPTVAILGWQFYFNYGSAQAESGFTIEPFAVFRLFAPQPWAVWLVVFTLCSVLFPLLVTVLYGRQAIRDGGLTLAWLGFAIAMGYYLFFAEQGAPSAANFRWGAQIALFILYVTALLFFVQQARESGWGWRFRIGAALFAWHVLSGVYAYAAYLAWVWSWIRPA